MITITEFHRLGGVSLTVEPSLHSYMTAKTRVLVTGAGGFIGHHLVSYLKDLGYWVRGVDIKEPEY